MKTIRAKIQIASVKHTGWGSEEIEAAAVCSGKNEDDNTYSKATPILQLKMTIDAPGAKGVLKAGDYCYIDFTLDTARLSPQQAALMEFEAGQALCKEGRLLPDAASWAARAGFDAMAKVLNTSAGLVAGVPVSMG